MSVSKRLGAVAAVLGLAALGTLAAPHPAEAWWRGGWCCGIGIGVVLPPVVVAPAPVYAPVPVYAPPPAPAYYAPPPGRVWVPGHWNGPYWVPAHWA